jgi:hypothetical protein
MEGDMALNKVLYRYYCKMRPPAPDAIPKRNLINAVAQHVELPGYHHFMWGYVEYTQPLNDEEIEEYELVPERVNE